MEDDDDFSFWNILVANAPRDYVARDEAADALTEVASVEGTIQNLRAKVTRLQGEVAGHEALVQRLKVGVSVIGDLLVASGVLARGGLEQRINDALAIEEERRKQTAEAARRAEEASREAQSEEMRREKEAAHARAIAPTTCSYCGKSVPMRSTFMTPSGLICGPCYELAKEK